MDVLKNSFEVFLTPLYSTIDYLDGKNSPLKKTETVALFFQIVSSGIQIASRSSTEFAKKFSKLDRGFQGFISLSFLLEIFKDPRSYFKPVTPSRLNIKTDFMSEDEINFIAKTLKELDRKGIAFRTINECKIYLNKNYKLNGSEFIWERIEEYLKPVSSFDRLIAANWQIVNILSVADCLNSWKLIEVSQWAQKANTFSPALRHVTKYSLGSYLGAFVCAAYGLQLIQAIRSYSTAPSKDDQKRSVVEIFSYATQTLYNGMSFSSRISPNIVDITKIFAKASRFYLVQTA